MLWINEEFAGETTAIIPFIGITYFLSTLTNLPSFAVMSFNYPRMISKYSIIRMVIVIICVYPLISEYHLLGAAATLLISQAQVFLTLLLVNSSQK